MKHKSLAPAFSTMPPLPCIRAANTARVGANLFAGFPHIHVPLLKEGTPSRNLLLLFPTYPESITIPHARRIMLMTSNAMPSWMPSWMVACFSSPGQISVSKIIRDKNSNKMELDLWYRLTQSERGSSLEIRPSRDAQIQNIHLPDLVEEALTNFGIPNITMLPEFMSYIENLGIRC
jgi:hypothetical protein